MLTQDVTQELEAVLSQLQTEGKEPTTALVKSRLSTKIPMPALIATIKRWQSLKQVPKVEVAAQALSDAEKITQLEQQVASLSQRLAQLEAKWEQQG